MSLRELRAHGVTHVYLNGWLESLNFVLSLDQSNIKYVGETKSPDGYSVIHCYEQVDN